MGMKKFILVLVLIASLAPVTSYAVTHVGSCKSSTKFCRPNKKTITIPKCTKGKYVNGCIKDGCLHINKNNRLIKTGACSA